LRALEGEGGISLVRLTAQNAARAMVSATEIRASASRFVVPASRYLSFEVGKLRAREQIPT